MLGLCFLAVSIWNPEWCRLFVVWVAGALSRNLRPLPLNHWVLALLMFAFFVLSDRLSAPMAQLATNITGFFTSQSSAMVPAPALLMITSAAA